MIEDALRARIDYVAELESATLGTVVDEPGTLQVYSRTKFSADGAESIEGTNTLTSATVGVFTTAGPVDDAGQTRTRNRHAALRAFVQALKSGTLAKDPNRLTTVLSHLANDVRHDQGLTTLELDKLCNSLRQLQADDIVVVTAPANSRRTEDGTVVDFDPEALPALKEGLAGNDLPDFFRYLASLGY